MKIQRKRWAIAGAALLGMASLAAISAAQQVKVVDSSDGDIEVVPIRGNIYLVGGAGSNIVLSTGSDGTLMVDTGLDKYADKVLAAVNHLAMDLAARVPAADVRRDLRVDEGPDALRDEPMLGGRLEVDRHGTLRGAAARRHGSGEG